MGYNVLAKNGNVVAMGNNPLVYRPYWDPSLISTALWLDADDLDTITESNNFVSQWDDKSGNDNNAVQIVSSNQPRTGTRNMNDVNVLDFDGNSDYLRLTSVFDFVDKSIFVVLSPDSVSATQMIMSCDTDLGDNNEQFRINGGGAAGRMLIVSNNCNWVGGTPTGVISTTALTATDNFIVQVDGGDPLKFWIDATQDASTDDRENTNPFEYRTIGAKYASSTTSSEFNGVIGEIIVLDSPSIDITQKIEGYLAWKWSLVSKLPGDHPYKNSSPRL